MPPMNRRPAFKTLLLLCLGILLGRQLHLPFYTLLSITIAIIAGTLAVQILKKHAAAQLGIALCLIALGCLNYARTTLVPRDHIALIPDSSRPVTIRGILIKDPVRTAHRTELLLASRTLIAADSAHSVRGNVLVRLNRDTDQRFGYGDEIDVKGHLERPKGPRNPGGYDARSSLLKKGIHTLCYTEGDPSIKKTGEQGGHFFQRKIIYPARRFVLKTIDQTSSGESRSVLRALLIGERSLVPSELRERFSNAGVIHILAVSGLHVGFILILFNTLFGFLRLPYNFRTLLTIAALIFYALLTEARPPVVRASCMAAVYLLGSLIERKPDPFNTVGMAGLGLLLHNPLGLFEVGFQLSFSAVIAIVYAYRRIEGLGPVARLSRWASRHALGRALFPLFLVSVSAQIGTLPFTAYYFNRISILSPLANLLAIPAAGMIVALGFTSLLAGIISPWTASIYGMLNQELLHLFGCAVSWIGNLPFSHIVCPRPAIFHLIIYSIMVILILNSDHAKNRKRLVFSLLVSMNFLIWRGVLRNEARKLTWIQFDVGQGDAALLRLPRRRTVLIDGGNRTAFFDNGESVIAPYLRQQGIRRIDAVVLSHPHDDHIGGLRTILSRFKVGELIRAGTPSESRHSRGIDEIIDRKRIPVRTVIAPDTLFQFPGVRMVFLSPDTLVRTAFGPGHNNQSLVCSIDYGSISLLFTGDIEGKVERHLIRKRRLRGHDAVKVAHHGSATSSTLPFVQAIRPAHAVISVGERNRFGHPSPDVIRRLKVNEIELHRTDRDGAVIFRTDGKTLTPVRWR